MAHLGCATQAKQRRAGRFNMPQWHGTRIHLYAQLVRSPSTYFTGESVSHAGACHDVCKRILLLLLSTHTTNNKMYSCKHGCRFCILREAFPDVLDGKEAWYHIPLFSGENHKHPSMRAHPHPQGFIMHTLRNNNDTVSLVSVLNSLIREAYKE
jgi:hypothetical protein